MVLYLLIIGVKTVKPKDESILAVGPSSGHRVPANG
jgi:hypothetical protein